MRTAILVGLFVLLLASGVFGYTRYHNELVGLDVAVDTQWKQVENQLVRQYELLPKLVSVAKTYAGHEKQVLEDLSASRARYLGADRGEKPQLAGRLDGAVIQVLALAERYPDLRADQHYRDLSYEIAGTKNRIAVERKRYNEIVGALNTRLRQVPWSLVARGLTARPFYESPADHLVEPELAL